MTGLRERKKQQTRQRIAEVAARMFAERGFDAVTVNEIAEAADVAKATLFSYFPTKEALALDGVGGDDLAGIVARRPAGRTPLEALRAHYRAFAAEQGPDTDLDALLARVRVIQDSPVLRDAANSLLYRQRQALAQVLTDEYGPRAAALTAAQIAACLTTLQESYFGHLLSGAGAQDAGRALARDVELAFDLLERGISHLEGR
ncbi:MULTISPECIES: TetR/AcrR family transcriptional regulator [Streptomyces]|uniref:TetR family transcriptional regulator n=1 Tax=Streptomyces thermoviolaceus subsp. thermoviolaceus TaxID=66860 RepID=A0ABX0YW14_STRTL|nr:MULTISPECIES: TetR family transcriptional regulator [Streptomyces]WTD46117.1 TetR/AcrR family transcriptional regulator [Streptomyces thermoviolaceus]NJP16633.1 TetR family transcriptional regulator [Streptomyces thermoviolaceus subsp. thermoviolaceus]RSS06855.1 TetR family transcriptional regulator [Streptomyces sp. WAC00469]GGV80939.1 TetR family transcriptional regulator [Streptomyces thermoviolaceus subsp. apingens]GHA74572.1 TetR family transcriptional regulator [Streptomyces thermovio